MENGSLGLEADELILLRDKADLAAATVKRKSVRKVIITVISLNSFIFSHFTKKSVLQKQNYSGSSKVEDREDSRAEEASSVDRRNNCSGGGSRGSNAPI